MIYWKPLRNAVMLALIGGVTVATLALAGFEKTSRQVFVDWPDLSVQEPPDGAEYEVLAIVEGGDNAPVVYVIDYTFKGRTFVLGAFECGAKFQVSKNTTFGLYDIMCNYRDALGQISKTWLLGTENGSYRQQF